MRSRSAFTLIELLIASVIFVTVSALATASLISTVHIEEIRKQGQDVSQQLGAASGEVRRDVGNSVAAQVIELSNTSHYWSSRYPDDELLIALVPRTDNLGGTAAYYELHMYCAALQIPTGGGLATGKVMTRFVFGSGKDGGITSIPTTVPGQDSSCTAANLSALFGLGPPLEEPLTDASVQSATVRFWSVWPSTAPSLPTDFSASQDPSAIRMEVTARWQMSNALNADQESRSSQPALSPGSTPVLYRQTFSRKQSFTYRI